MQHTRGGISEDGSNEPSRGQELAGRGWSPPQWPSLLQRHSPCCSPRTAPARGRWRHLPGGGRACSPVPQVGDNGKVSSRGLWGISGETEAGGGRAATESPVASSAGTHLAGDRPSAGSRQQAPQPGDKQGARCSCRWSQASLCCHTRSPAIPPWGAGIVSPLPKLGAEGPAQGCACTPRLPGPGHLVTFPRAFLRSPGDSKVAAYSFPCSVACVCTRRHTTHMHTPGHRQAQGALVSLVLTQETQQA